MSLSTFNPEIVRNARIQLRPARIVVVIAICAAISLSAAAYYLSGPMGRRPSTEDARDLLKLMLTLQIITLLFGGGIFCTQAVHREKELNTFDYQRITRLTPVELVIGKLFGAPVQMYFSFLCLMPVALWAAFRGNIPSSNLAKIYVLILLGSVAYHSLALLLSLVMERGTSAGGIVLFLILVWISSNDWSRGDSPVGVHALSPFFVFELFPVNGVSLPGFGLPSAPVEPSDSFFGMAIPHFWVLVVLYSTMAAWFVLAEVRNVKRDPVAYELYSPTQGFAFSLYLNLLLLGFFRWSLPAYHFSPTRGSWVTFEPISPGQAEVTFLAISLFSFALYGLTLLRNRDRIRRRTREIGAQAAAWWACVWPAPYLLVGSILAGFAIVWMIQHQLHPQAEWTWRLGLLEAAFFSIWIARDILYLQWMNLRRVRRPILVGVLYMIVFYTCASTVFLPLHWYEATRAPYASIFIPLHAFQLSMPGSMGQSKTWAMALGLICLEAGGFALLQWRALQEILRSPAQS